MFKGTATRTKFLMTTLMSFVIALLGIMLMFLGINDDSTITMVLGLLTIIAGAVISYGVGAQRFRDLGHSPWWVLTYSVPYVSLAVVIYLGLAKGKEQQ